MANNILFEQTNQVATITLNQPSIHNAFDDQMVGELVSILKEIETNEEIRVVILQANGKHFSAGADLNWMKRMANYTEEQNYDDALSLAELLSRLNRLNRPVIGLVQGAGIGGGLGLVCCCDIVIAAENAFFCFSEVRLGLIPAVISPYVIDAIGSRQTRRYMLTAERFDAQQAFNLGLVHEIAPQDQLSSQSQHFIEQLLTNGPEALAQAKSLIQFVNHKEINPHLLKQTAQWIADVRVSDEAQEGINAFLQKRSAQWVNDD